MDLLRAVAVFVRVAEGGSFIAASRTLGESPAAITRQVGALEAHFGVRLLHRTTRHLALTPDGEELLAHAHALLEAAEVMEAGLGRRRHAPAGLVRFGCSVAFAQFLMPRLRPLLERHPALTIELVISDHLGDLVEDRLDLAVALGAREETSLVARRLCDVRHWLVAAPPYLAKAGVPGGPADLGDHRCLVHTDLAPAGVWRLQGPEGEVTIRPAARFSANNTEAIHRAARAGWGIALVPEQMVRDEIADGTLTRVLPRFGTHPEPAMLFYPSRRHLPPRTRAVIDFVVEATRDLLA